MARNVIKMHPSDNVLVALTDLGKGHTVLFEGQSIQLMDDIPAKHKFFVRDLPPGALMKMYGAIAGTLQRAVAAGELMTVENVKHAAAEYIVRNGNYSWKPPGVADFIGKSFDGYHRRGGNVGTANYWLFVPTVFCEQRNMDVIKQAMLNGLGYVETDKYANLTRQLVDGFQSGIEISEIDFSQTPRPGLHPRVFKNVDGIKFLNHSGGCGGTRQDATTLGKVLASYANHPNVGGVTVLSLGCQHLQVETLLREIRSIDPNFDKPLLVFEQQRETSEEQLVSDAIRKTFEGLIRINKTDRKAAPLSKLCIGVKCGGSDGFSGISANPAVGYAADLLVALGGKILLAEFPELCGAEQEIIDRCTDISKAEKFSALMKSYDALAHRAGSGFHMNPSPGNIKDGLITDAIKSLGAVRKAGSSPVTDVLDYAEQATAAGLNLVCTPGNDVESTTGMAAAGANLILFTTGLGTPTGNPICPVIKLSTDSALYKRMNDIIDFDCGPIITGEKSVEQTGRGILSYCIEVASGRAIPKAVKLNQDDFIPWKRGVSL